jgi:hypothetical protein
MLLREQWDETAACDATITRGHTNAILLEASRTGDLEVIKLLLLSQNLDIHVCSFRAIRMAVLGGHGEIARLLFEHHEQNIRYATVKPYLSIFDDGVHLALKQDNRDCVEAVLMHSFQLGRTRTLFSLLSHASYEQVLWIWDLLIAKKVDSFVLLPFIDSPLLVRSQLSVQLVVELILSELPLENVTALCECYTDRDIQVLFDTRSEKCIALAKAIMTRQQSKNSAAGSRQLHT